MDKSKILKGMDEQLNDVLTQAEASNACHEACITGLAYDHIVELESYFNELVWGGYMNEFKVEEKAEEFASSFVSYAQLIDVVRKWNIANCWHCKKVLHVIFSHDMLCHFNCEEMSMWVIKLDNILEGFTKEEYILHEDEGKRDLHMTLFYLNACAKIMLSTVTEEEKKNMYDMLEDYETYKTIKIVASIYYNTPWVCSTLADMCSVAGTLINKRKEHYASIFLIAERHARHFRKCKFVWQSKKNNFYNMMVGWNEKKEQRNELVGILTLIFPNVEDWEPAHSKFHLVRSRKSSDDDISPKVKKYVDRRHQEGIEHIDRRCDETERKYESLRERMFDNELLNRKEHLDLSERIGRTRVQTEVNVGSGGLYVNSVNKQNVVGSNVDEETIQKLIE